MNKYLLLRLWVGAVVGILTFLAVPVSVAARSLEYTSYHVTIDVHADSTVDVEEELSIIFTGEYQGVQRGVTLENPRNLQRCLSGGNLTCGGFERIALIGVYDENGDLVPASDYEVGELEDEDTGERYYLIRWTVWPGGKNHDGREVFKWSIKYRLYGSLGWINDRPYLYWNALPEDRGGPVDSATVDINFPDDVLADADELQIYAQTPSSQVFSLGNKLSIDAGSLPAYSDFTVAYPIPAEAVARPGKFTYFGLLPLTGTRVKIDGIDLGDLGGGLLNFPAGKHEVEFSFPGYEPKVVTVDMKSAGAADVDASLQPTPGMWLLLIIDLVLNLIGLVLLPIVALWVYHTWRTKGRDQNMPATIVPAYTPPKYMAPYLLGSLKDESVDREDITGTIIDLAYRGFLKIKELKKDTNYELIRLNKEGEAELTSVEQQLLEDIFGSQDTRETKKLGDRFATKYPILQKKIYEEMVAKNYFSSPPQNVRTKYYGLGTVALILGFLATFVSLIVGSLFLGVPGPVLLGIVLVVLGLSWLVVAKHMPAKTPLGSKTFAEILGFRMYLYTAERYRLQGLNPDEFERYLSYAIVFGIEKQWADKFKDIYKGQPSWYEGSSDAIWDAYWLSRFSRSFANSVNNTVFTPTTSGKGSGWSGGGGSFGGFSGGGGGGGFSGGF